MCQAISNASKEELYVSSTQAVMSGTVITFLEIGIIFCPFPFDTALVTAKGQQCLLAK